jgi:hypothetical protein
MANQTLAIPLNAASFPLIMAHAGNAVLQNSDLGPRMPSAFFGNKVNAEYGIPQMLFCENVIPYASGLFSVSYSLQVPAYTSPPVPFDSAIALRDKTEKHYTFVPAKGTNYVLDPLTEVWTSTSPFTFLGSLVTYAYVNGRTFVCYERNRVIEFNTGTATFTTVTLTLPAGVTIADIRGIGNASNYLLLFTDLTVYWCSPLNVLDFANVDAGAGQQIPIDIAGQITGIRPVSGGVIIYTTRNAVGAAFTNNSAAPFVFKGINGCGGVASIDRVTDEADFSGNYAWTSKGLLKVTLDAATPVFPEVTDFLVGQVFDTWDATAKQVVQSTVVGGFTVKLAFVAGRYLIISYGGGSTEFEFALIYDAALERWGKLKVPHVDVYSYTYVTAAGNYNWNTLAGDWDDLTGMTWEGLGIDQLTVPDAKRGIAFLRASGEINVLRTNYNQVNTSAVAVFGMIQQVHGRTTTVTAARLAQVTNCAVHLLGSKSGDNRDATVAMLPDEISGEFTRYKARETAKNFAVAVEGTFMLSSFLVDIQSHGSR